MHNTCCFFRTYLLFSLFIFTNALRKTDYLVVDQETNVTYYPFTAMMQIQFKNGCKKFCSGAVISDNVLLTSAQCLSSKNNEPVPIDLNLSFIVIGTKQMYSSGHEQYVPIERIEFFTDYKKMHIDLAMVFADEDLKANRGASVVKIIDTKIINMLQEENDKGVTVLSWEEMSAQEKKENGLPTKDVDSHLVLESGSKSDGHLRAVSSNKSDSAERYMRKQYANLKQNRTFNDLNQFRRSLLGMGIINQQAPYILASVTFELLTPEMCFAFLNHAKPNWYKDDVISRMICFTSNSYYITNTDLGAPVLYHGTLVGVTVGHVEQNHQYVGFALQVSCFCEWIASKSRQDIECSEKCCMTSPSTTSATFEEMFSQNTEALFTKIEKYTKTVYGSTKINIKPKTESEMDYNESTMSKQVVPEMTTPSNGKQFQTHTQLATDVMLDRMLQFP